LGETRFGPSLRCALPELVALGSHFHGVRPCPDRPVVGRTGKTNHVQPRSAQRDLLATVKGIDREIEAIKGN
jgi:hypothetical protein